MIVLHTEVEMSNMQVEHFASKLGIHCKKVGHHMGCSHVPTSQEMDMFPPEGNKNLHHLPLLSSCSVT